VPEPVLPGGSPFRASVLALLLLLITAPAGAADGALHLPPPGDAPEAWLVTYAPGDIYWQRFGHNAIWLRDPEQSLDHAFNFGFFDFGQPHFLRRFIMARMLYLSAAQPAAREFAQYQLEKRTITAQRLNFDQAQYRRLRDHLLRQVQPENRDYLYDYYLDNCSTRIRDALDVALEGAFAERYRAQPAQQNLREHTRRSVAADFWYYLGLEAVLALPVDRKITAWDEMFLPARVADSAAAYATRRGPLAGPAQLIYASAAAPPPAQPPQVWGRYLAAGLGLALLFALIARGLGPLMAQASALAWLMLTATAGALLLFLWSGTDHVAAGPNVNIVLLNPLYLAGLLPGLRRGTAWLMLGGLGVAGGQLLFPGHQFNLDLVAFLAPLHLTCTWWLLGRAPDFEPWFSLPGQGGQTTLS